MAKRGKEQEVELTKLKPYEKNAKIHSPAQVQKIADSIQEFGFLNACLIDKDYNIIAGHGRVEAAKLLGMETVPCTFIEGLTEEQRKAYILADNKLTELGDWDEYLVNQELKDLQEAGFNIELTGFEIPTDEEEEDPANKLTAEVFLPAVLPESRVYICSVSTFGTETENILIFNLPQETADRLLGKIREASTAEVATRMREFLSDL